jgi:hypothetical protein
MPAGGRRRALMPFEYERDDERRRITIRVTGKIDIAEAFAVVDRHRTENVWGYGMLYDLISLEGAPDPSQVAQVSDYVQRHAGQRPRGPVAFVTTNPVAFEMVRMYSMMNRNDLRVAAFHSMDAAERWLDEQR